MSKNNMEGKKLDKPIFIHSLWRSSSTYFLEKFRGDNMMTFAEPFNEFLGKAQREDILSADEDLVSLLHHPETDKHYFAEYKYLLKSNVWPRDEASRLFAGQGVRKHRVSFVLNHYFQSKFIRAQHNYVESLIKYARKKCNARAVLGFTRSLGRIKYLCQKIDAYNIVLMRDPFNQFFSAYQQLEKHGNPYFLIQYVYIVSLSQSLPEIFEFCMLFGVQSQIVDSLDSFDSTYNALVLKYSQNIELCMRCFSIVYILSYVISLHENVQVIIPELFQVDSGYREKVAFLLKKETAIDIDFSDCRCVSYTSPIRNQFDSIFEETLSFLVTKTSRTTYSSFLSILEIFRLLKEQARSSYSLK